jgi:predicted RNA-binding Zn-ribbon protein involved in translation (DUF1610 family)
MRKFKKDGIVWLDIPLSEWRCPACGSKDLVDDTEEEYEVDLIRADAPLYCGGRDKDGYDCGWSGDAIDLYHAQHKVLNTKPCPTCGGSGVVPYKKGESHGY